MNAPHGAVAAVPRISRRGDSLGTENAFVVLAEVNALIRQGQDIVSFCIGQPDFPTPANIQDRLVILSDSSASDMHDTPPSLVNGSSTPAPIALCTGVSHRIRVIGISAITGRRLRLLDDTTLVQWTPLAKDGRELPLAQQSARLAAAKLGAGETMDMEFTPSHAGAYTLEVTSLYGTVRVMRVRITSSACGPRAHRPIQ